MICIRSRPCIHLLLSRYTSQNTHCRPPRHHVSHTRNCDRRLATKSGPSYTLERPELARDWAVHPMMSIPIVCFILGYWQVERRKAKLQLLADIESRCDMEPVPFDSKEDYLEYTPVAITGEYDYSYEFYLGPRHEVVEGKDKGAPGGYHSIVPMKLDSGERVLVDRGWVQSRTDKPAGQIKGKVTLVGYIRQAEGAVMGALAPKPGSSQTYIWRDSAVMGRASGSLPITVELKGEHSVRDGPIAGQTRLSLYNKHMEYIFTWWSMGIASLFYVFRYKRKPKALPKIFK